MTDAMLEEGRRSLRKINQRQLNRRLRHDPRFRGQRGRAYDGDLSELVGLELPPVLPGETPPMRVKPDMAADPFFWYDPEGVPIPGDMREASDLYHRYRGDPRNHKVSGNFYRNGTLLWVSTVYLGIDQSFRSSDEPRPAIIWESMVFAGAEMDDKFMARYATRAAATHGHALIVAAIAAESRRRRAKDLVTAPRCSQRGRAARRLGGALP